MSEDVEDTVITPARPAVAPSGPDLDDTIVASRRPDVHAERADVIPLPSTDSVLAWFSFRIGEHARVITLDRPSYIGRRPSAPRVVSGAVPRLVRVPSPLREVSSSHLEVRQVGTSVVVTDLRSTNGSVVMLPGTVPRKLRQGESVVVSPGTLVDIGDGNIVQILPMQRPTDAGRQP